MQYPEIELYLGGEWRKTHETGLVVNPADECEIGRFPVAGKELLDTALQAASDGLKVWSRTPPAVRAEILRRAAALMRERIGEIALTITLEQGKPLTESRAEVIRGCEFFEWDAGECVRAYGRVIPSAPGIRYLVIHQPIGAVAAFSPWNFPMSQPARKIGGAIAAGCSVIIKAAEETPGGALHIARALHDAGLPPGVLNLVFGDPAKISSHLIPQDQVRLVAFTGSTAVGKHLSELAARYMTPVLMELGGHAPVIVCGDADPEIAGVTSALRKFRNAGQVCTSPTRFFVLEPLFDRFTAAFAETAKRLKVGNGLDAATQMGPVANVRRAPALQALVEDAKHKGARVLAGGEPVAGQGYFFTPTVLAELPDDALAMSVEPFGPLALVNPVRSLDEAIEKANQLPFGLAGYGFTNDVPTADRLVEEVQVGNFSINTLEASVAETPFGGVKDSGYGREGGAEGLSHYSVVKTVSHQMILPPAL